MMVRPIYTLFVISSILASIFTYTVKAHALEVPVLVQSASGSRVLILLDDSHSMWNVIEHPDYNKLLETTCKHNEQHPRCLISGTNPAKYRSFKNYFISGTNGQNTTATGWNSVDAGLGFHPYEGYIGLPHHIWRIKSGAGIPSISSPIELALVLENSIATTPERAIPNEVNINRDEEGQLEYSSSLTLGTVSNSSLLQGFTCGTRFECMHEDFSYGVPNGGYAPMAWFAVGKGGDYSMFGNWAHRLGYDPFNSRLAGKSPSQYSTIAPRWYPQHALRSLSVGATTLTDRRNTLMKYTDPFIVGAELFSADRLHRQSDLLTIRNSRNLAWTFPQQNPTGNHYVDSAGNEFQYTLWRNYRLPPTICPYSGSEGGETSGSSGGGGDSFDPGGGGGGGGGGGNWGCQPGDNNWALTVWDKGFYHSLGGEINFMGKIINLPRGRYEPDYLFWILYIANNDQLSQLQKNKWDIALDTIKDVIEKNTNIEFSFDTFNRWRRKSNLNAPFGEVVFNNGPKDESLQNQVVAPFSSNANKDTARAELLDQIKKSLPFGKTPMGKGYLNAANYLVNGVGGTTTPISDPCASYSIILISDGLPEGEFNTTMSWNGTPITDVDNDNNNGKEKGTSSANCQDQDCGYWVDDLAYMLKNTDLRTDMEGIQSIRTGVVGFGLADQLLDQIARNGGTGTAYLAEDSDTLAESLNELLSQVIVSPASGSAVMISESLEDPTAVYRPRFQADKWTGNIDIFTVNQQGNLVYSDDLAIGYKNLQPNSRTVVVGKPFGNSAIDTKDIDFTPANADKLKASLFAQFDTEQEPLPATLLEEPLRDKDTVAAEKLINFIRGQKIDGLRSRDRDETNKPNADLGDIVYSPIVEVRPRNGNYLDLTGYADYIKNNNRTERVLLVGANDGMLHAFGKTSKIEKWSFIPGNVVSSLHYLSRRDYASTFRRSYVDGKITIHDIYINGSWRTIAVVGLRTGGTSYSVLDITNRTQRPTLLFEVNDPDQQLGQSWSKPEIIATIKSGRPNKSSDPNDYIWHLVVGSSERRAQNGTKLAVYSLLGDGIAPVPTFLNLNQNAPKDIRLGDILAVQSDRDVAVDRLYVGSEDGNFYRIDLNSSAPSEWNTVTLLSLGLNAPITTKPTAVLVENPNRNFDGMPMAIGVYFGTGRFDNSSDVNLIKDSVRQYIVGLFDPVKIANDDYVNSLTSLTLSQLKNQTGASFSSKLNASTGLYELAEGTKGFYHQLAISSTPEGGFIPPVGMVTRNPINREGVILFPTFLPESISQNNCSFGGESFIVGIEMRTGGGAAADYGLPNGRVKYNGGIRDFDQNSEITDNDISDGYNSKLLHPVLDAYQPQDNKLTRADFNPKEVTQGIALRSNVIRLSSGGMPLEASILTGSSRLLVQTSLIGSPTIGEPEPPQDGTVPTPGNPIDGATLPKPNTALISLLKHPAKFLTYHEVTNEGP